MIDLFGLDVPHDLGFQKISHNIYIYTYTPFLATIEPAFQKRQIGCYGYPWVKGAVSSIVKRGHSRGYGYGLARIFPFLRVIKYENPSIQ